MARKYHPDLNPNDKEAESKELNEANEVLSSTENRKNTMNTAKIGKMQYEQSKDNNTTNEVDNKLISVAVERIIRTLNLCLAGAPQGGGRRSAWDRILMLNSILT
jgi:DnaJ-class molecular chaperone